MIIITMTSVVFIIYLVALSVVALTITVVFCFWFVYILEAILRKRSIYRNYIQRGDNSCEQQILTYNAETEFVKYAFLFFMNIVEWLAFILAYADYIFNSVQVAASCQHVLSGIHSVNKSESWLEQHIPCLVNNTMSRIHSNSILLMANNCVVLSIVLVLYNYLAARSAHRTWITSKRLPYIIGLFLAALFAIHFAAFHCSIIIVARWFNALLMTASFIMGLKQYRLLSIVTNWTIIDLKVSQNKELLEKQMKVQRMFRRVSASLWIGIVIILSNKYLGNLLSTSTLIIRFYHTRQFQISLCENTDFSFHQFTNSIIIIYFIKRIFVIVGSAFIFIPYIGYGLSTMCVVLWRRITGKTGYRTHFHNEPLF